MRQRFVVLSLLVGLLAYGVACDAAGDSAASDVVGANEDTGSEYPPGTGPAAECGRLNAGTWLEGSATNSAGDDSLRLEVSSFTAKLDLSAKFEGETMLLAYVSPGSDTPLITLEGDGTELRIPQVPVADGLTSGQIFDRDGFGGEIVEGRLCFERLPVVGEPASGSYVFLVALGEERLLHRVQGYFSVLGEAVTRADTLEGRLTAVTIEAGMGATVLID